MVSEDENEQVTLDEVTKLLITVASDNPYNDEP
jgi:hypothetical protein